MNKAFSKSQKIIIILIILVSTEACFRVRLNAPQTLPTVGAIEPFTPQAQIDPTSTLSAINEKIPTYTSTQIIPSQTNFPKISITALKGNIYIRRGPGMAYNPIAVLYKNKSARVSARDVLSKWVQVTIPDSDQTGWISIQTEFTKLTGEISSLPEVIPTDWPIPAYLRNCTLHDMYIMPGKITLPGVYAYPDNEIWLYPGSYTVQDLFVPGEPEVLDFEIREGLEIKIQTDGVGEHRKC